MRSLYYFLAAIMLASSLPGCSVLNNPARQARREARNQSLRQSNYQLGDIKTVGFMYPDVHLFEYSTGVREEMDEWSLQAAGNFVNSINQSLSKEGMAVKSIDPDADKTDRMPNLYFLFRAVSEGLNWNTTYRKALCPDVQTCPDYSLGKVDDLLDFYGVDALLFVLAYNEIETLEHADARSASKAKAAFLQSLVHVRVKVMRPPGTYVSMALVDRTGTVIWYVGKSTDKGFDLRDPLRVNEMSKTIFSRLWAKEK